MPKQADNNNATRRPTPEEYRAARRRVQRETTRVVKRTLIGLALFAGMYYLVLATNARQAAPPNEPEAPRATVDADAVPPVETPVPNVDAENAPPVETPVPNADAENAPPVETPPTLPTPTPETPVENASPDAVATP